MSSSKAALFRYKVVFVGDASVGKTSIINRFCNIQGESSPTVSATSTPVDVKVQDTIVGLNIWDTAGQETYKCLVPVYARGAKVAILVYDQSNHSSYESLEDWINYLKVDVGVNDIIICANKMDLPTTISFDDVQNRFLEQNIPVIQTSALTGDNVEALFHTVASTILETQQTERKISNAENSLQPTKKGCC